MIRPHACAHLLPALMLLGCGQAPSSTTAGSGGSGGSTSASTGGGGSSSSTGGGGSTSECTAASDCPGATDCVEAICEQGACATSFAAEGTACAENGGSLCDGKGACLECLPGSTEACYEGPAGTQGVGLCTAGVKTCAPDGAGDGACEGQVLPEVEKCATAGDEDCDGSAPACNGTLLWAKHFGPTIRAVVTGVAADAMGNLVVVGSIEGKIDFGGGALTSAGLDDVFALKLDANGNHLWSKRFGDGVDQFPTSVAIDAGGNVIIAGSFEGTLNLGGGNLVAPGAAVRAFVAKLDAGGNHVWSKGFGNSFGTGSDAAVAPDGSIVLVGEFASYIDFGGGALASAGGYDGYVAKLDGQGNHLWSKSLGGTGDQIAYKVAVDAGGNVITAGGMQGSADFGGGTLTSAGDEDAFVVKLDGDGSHLWSKRFGTDKREYAYEVTADAGGNVVLAGNMYGAVDFGGGPVAYGGGWDVFLAKLDSDGGHLWSKGFGAAGDQQTWALAVDAAGDVLLEGTLDGGGIDFGGGTLAPSGEGGFVAELDPSGTHLWSRLYDWTSGIAAGAVTSSGANVVVAAAFVGTVDFGGGAVSSSAAGDAWIATYAP